MSVCNGTAEPVTCNGSIRASVAEIVVQPTMIWQPPGPQTHMYVHYLSAPIPLRLPCFIGTAAFTS